MNDFTATGFFLLLVILGCAKNTEVSDPHVLNAVDAEVVIRDTTVRISELNYDNQKPIWTLNKQPYSGYAASFDQDSMLTQKIGFSEGQKEKLAFQWYPDGHLKQMANYQNGKLHGEKKVWSPNSNHVLISHLNYHLGKPHGEQKKWYSTGELYKKMNLNMGKEEGLQQAFRKNGELYANYEAKNGRTFGLKKAALCFGLEDEEMR